MTDAQDLAGQVAVITGAAGGLGREICRSLAAAGAVVIAADIDGERASGAARALAGDGHAVEPVAVDLRDNRRIEAMLEDTLARHGRLDILVNNAGVDRTVSVVDLAVAEWDEILDVNLRAPFVASRAAFRLMDPAVGGRVVNIVSTAGLRAWSNAAAYHASKWGLRGLSQALHVEGRDRNIRVTAVIAGGMRTPFLLDRFPDIDPLVLQEPASVARAVRFALTQPPESVVAEITVLPGNEGSWP